MKRVFVFQDFKSQKFWSIEVVGTDITVNYGKLGTDGQTQPPCKLGVPLLFHRFGGVP